MAQAFSSQMNGAEKGGTASSIADSAMKLPGNPTQPGHSDQFH
jgi:hypothetical protein